MSAVTSARRLQQWAMTYRMRTMSKLVSSARDIWSDRETDKKPLKSPTQLYNNIQYVRCRITRE